MTFVPLDELLQTSDFVSLHSPLTAETRHQVGERELALMKRSAYLINTSRGPVVDEEPLVAALQRRQISGAALDVFEHEPVVTPALLAMPNVVMTPHLGSTSGNAGSARERGGRQRDRADQWALAAEHRQPGSPGPPAKVPEREHTHRRTPTANDRAELSAVSHTSRRSPRIRLCSAGIISSSRRTRRLTRPRPRSSLLGGFNLFYREAGAPNAPKLLLLHGFPSASHMFAISSRFWPIAST